MDILHLEFLARTNRRRLEEHLCNPFFRSWGRLSRERFTQGYLALKSRLSDSQPLLRLVDLHLITEFLVFREKAPEWMGRWMEEHAPVHDGFLEIGWEPAASGRWLVVPVVLALDRGYLRYFVAGLAPCGAVRQPWLAWADSLMDETSKTAISRASRACAKVSPPREGQSLLCYPLMAANATARVEGASLGLPLALGFLQLLSGESVSGGLVATGAIDEKGSVIEAGHLEQKIMCAAREGFEVFLYPSGNSTPAVPERMEALPVSRLEEAWMFGALHAPGAGGELPLLAGMLNDPEKFVNNCDCVPEKWLSWAHEHGRTAAVMGEIQTSRERFEGFVRKFRRCLDRRRLEKAGTLSNLFSPEELGETARIAPLATFKWHTLSMALANHRGNVSEALKCSNRAEVLLDDARSCDLNECATYHNHRFVTEHNRYFFEPRVPDQVRQTLRHLERRYELACKEGCPTDITLGCLYGSIAQNFGFCGPEYLSDTERYSRLARKAFGDGTVKECRKDWLRQFNYATYAALDAGRFQQAEETLFRYLGIEEWEGLWPSLPDRSPWELALLCRFLAGAGEKEAREQYLNRAADELEGHVKREHPWQLWMFNLGRIARISHKDEMATRLYDGSLDLCLSEKNGPTVRVMALLPLSGLWDLNQLAAEETKTAEQTIRKAAQPLNPVHFTPLLGERDFGRVLETVWNQPGTLFPFSYR